MRETLRYGFLSVINAQHSPKWEASQEQSQGWKANNTSIVPMVSTWTIYHINEFTCKSYKTSPQPEKQKREQLCFTSEPPPTDY